MVSGGLPAGTWDRLGEGLRFCDRPAKQTLTGSRKTSRHMPCRQAWGVKTRSMPPGPDPACVYTLLARLSSEPGLWGALTVFSCPLPLRYSGDTG